VSEQKLNIELFKKIRDKIATTPEAYNQSVFARASEVAPCGTVACIAGWACVLGDRMSITKLREGSSLRASTVPVLASEALNLTNEEADVLFTGNPAEEDFEEFHVRAWPEPYASEWLDSTFISDDEKIPEQARIAVGYLDHIIASGKVLE